ncbi:MAG TPA: dynamin family protein, partial [Thermoanaerobaculia bacterium]|nr:dynamin family protein [Thermoanaerobaculia bacterium]
MISEGKRHDIMDVLDAIRDSAEQWSTKIEGADEEEQSRIRTRLLALAGKARSERANIEEPFRLGVVGMFKAGKSSLLNTWLERSLLVEGRVETTAVLTELRFAPSPEDESAAIVYRDGTSKPLTVAEALQFTDVRSDEYRNVDADARRKKQAFIDRIILNLHSDILRTVTLVDTPGFGGSLTGDLKAFEALGHVDAAVMIFEPEKIGHSNERAVADYLYTHGRDVVAVLNKADDNNGHPRAEAQLRDAEEFLLQNFRTLAKDGSDAPIIFRYSAKEVAKAQETLRNAADDNGRRDALERLGRWGYAASGPSQREQGAIAFIRDRYFSSGSANAYRQKLLGARAAVATELESSMGAVGTALKNAEADHSTAKGEHEARLKRLNDEIEPKIDFIESEIERIVRGRVEGFVREIEEILEGMLKEQEDLDTTDIVKAFRSKETIAAELRRDFLRAFPERRQTLFLDEIDHQINRLMQHQWRYVFDSIHKLDAAVELPDITDLLQSVQAAVREIIIVLAANMVGLLLASIFLPGGVVLVELASNVFLAQAYSKHKSRTRHARQTIKQVLKNYAEELARKIAQKAISVNDSLAEKARLSARGELSEID